MDNSIVWIPVKGRTPRASTSDHFKAYQGHSDRVLLWVQGYQACFGFYHTTLKQFFVEGMTNVDQQAVTHFAYINQPS